jgi:hypothetical protein
LICSISFSRPTKCMLASLSSYPSFRCILDTSSRPINQAAQWLGVSSRPTNILLYKSWP